MKNGYKKAIVFEDDVRFSPYFKTKLTRLMSEVEQNVKDWDLM